MPKRTAVTKTSQERDATKNMSERHPAVIVGNLEQFDAHQAGMKVIRRQLQHMNLEMTDFYATGSKTGSPRHRHT